MKRLKYFTMGGILFVLITGSLAHFLYDWSGNNLIIGLFSPVSESIWEHMKLIFFPMAVYSCFMFFSCRNTYPCIASSLCLGNLTGTLLIPVFFYAYSTILGRDVFILDIITFFLSTLIAFYIVYKYTLPRLQRKYAIIIYGLTAVMLLCFLLFTYQPPSLPIFANPAVLLIPHTLVPFSSCHCPLFI
ncbi:MAG: hypothetical protein K2P44_02795 [Lachnospiraceae bacterium]|nr:hypothetical protein [Lachnospiraceae bacterium]